MDFCPAALRRKGPDIAVTVHIETHTCTCGKARTSGAQESSERSEVMAIITVMDTFTQGLHHDLRSV